MIAIRALLLVIPISIGLSGRSPDSPAAAPRRDAWKILGPGGGGTLYMPTVSPHDPNTVLATCDMTGAYISRDGGHSWRNFNLRGRIDFLVFDPADPKTIYAANHGLWRSADSGRSWRLVFPPPASVKQVMMSDDHAAEKFATVDGRRLTVTALAVDPGDSRTLFAAIEGDRQPALHRSTDAGLTWREWDKLPFRSRRLYVAPRSPKPDRAIYAVGPNSISVREAGRWSHGPAPDGVSRFQEVSAGFSAKDGRLLVYAVASRQGNSSPGLSISTDGGRSWQTSTIAMSPVSSPDYQAVACSQRTPEVAYVSYSNLRRLTGTYFGVAKTTDAGRNWEIVWSEARSSGSNIHDAWLSATFGPGWPGSPTALGVAPGNPDISYGADSGRIMRTTDGGRTWEAAYSKRLDGGFTTTGLDVTTCYGVHFDPFDPRRLFISYTDIGLFRSEDGGTTWLSSISGVPRPWRNTTYWLEFDPEVKGRVWGVMSGIHDLPRPKMWRGRSTLRHDGGVSVSEDGGKTWRVAATNLPATAATHILLDPASPAAARTLYVTGMGRGVFKSTDGGVTWTLKNRGIAGADPLAWRLAGDRAGSLYLVVARRSEDGSYGNSGDGALYRSDDGAESWTVVPLPNGLNGPNGIAVDPRDPRRLYLAAWRRAVPDADGLGGIWLSSDRGKSWRRVLSEDQHVYDVTIEPRDPNILYASGFSASAWRSSDRGLTWRRIRGFNFKWGHRVIPDPQDPKMVFITTFGGSVWYGPAEGDPSAPEDIVPDGLPVFPGNK